MRTENSVFRAIPFCPVLPHTGGIYSDAWTLRNILTIQTGDNHKVLSKIVLHDKQCTIRPSDFSKKSANKQKGISHGLIHRTYDFFIFTSRYIHIGACICICIVYNRELDNTLRRRRAEAFIWEGGRDHNAVYGGITGRSAG